MEHFIGAREQFLVIREYLLEAIKLLLVAREHFFCVREYFLGSR